MVRVGNSQFQLDYPQVNMFLTGVIVFGLSPKYVGRLCGIPLHQGQRILAAYDNGGRA